MEPTSRLAELVVHLTECEPRVAIAAVDAAAAEAGADPGDALSIVARAMCLVRRIDLTDQVDLRDTREIHTR